MQTRPLSVLSGLLAFWVSTVAIAQEKPNFNKYGVDPARVVDGVYRGRFTPDANYVLDGKLRKDIGPLPENPFKYLTAKEGYDASAFPAPPPAGVHPRVLMNPEDIATIREKVEQGDAAGRYFQIVWKDLQDRANQKNKNPIANESANLMEKAVVALVTDNDILGRETAVDYMKLVDYYSCIVDILNTDPRKDGTRDNWWYYSRMTIGGVGGMAFADAYREGGSKRVRELAAQRVDFGDDTSWMWGENGSKTIFSCSVWVYDYVYKYLTNEERDAARDLLSRMTKNRYTSGMGLPGNMFINNHQSMGEDLLLHALAIEGEEGYEPRILKEYSKAVLNKLTYDISPGGLLHEKCKGFLPERAAVAITKRQQYPLMSLDRMKALVMGKVMDSNFIFDRYIGTHHERGSYEMGKGNESRRLWYMGFGSGPWMDQFFNWAFIIKKAFPQDPAVDYFYKERLRTQGFGAPGLPFAEHEKVAYAITRSYTHRDLMILCATDGLTDQKDTPVDYDATGLPPEITQGPLMWKDMQRGVAMSRNTWDKDSLMVHYECRSDVYSAGHETPEANDFYLYANGVEWTTRRLWYMDSYFRNMVLIDGYAGVYSPVAGKLMLAEDTVDGSTFVSDATDQYNWRKREKNFYSWLPMLDENPSFAAVYPGGKWQRNWEVPFQKQMRVYHEGYAGLDWGNWHGETRGPEMFERWNEVDHVFRTLHLSKGKKPYVLIVDDVRKDDQMHNYDWCMLLSPDIVHYSGNSSVQGRHLDKGMPDERWTDIHLCTIDVPYKRYKRYGFNTHRDAQKGDPMLLVRVLWRDSQFAFPQPSVEQGYGPARVIIPAMAVDPRFRVLIFPYTFGDEMPVTLWNSDQTELTVRIGDTTDVYTFDQTDRERTVFSKKRNGQEASAVASGPAAPQLDLPTGYTIDQNQPDATRSHLFTGKTEVAFKNPGLGKEIRYTLDGSEPTRTSPLYTAPIQVESSANLNARSFAAYWPYGTENGSKTTSFNLIQSTAAKGVLPGETVPGLRCDVHEAFIHIFDNETGVFTGKKNMIPELAEKDLLTSCRVDIFRAPPVTPRALPKEMKWGYYTYSGFFQAETKGVYHFELDSCGPVVFEIGGQQAIDMNGVYGNSQKKRYGSAALEPGLHALKLTVCDPVLWKNGAEGPYPIAMNVMTPEEKAYAPVSASLLSTLDQNVPMDQAPPVPVGTAVVADHTVPGLQLNKYFRAELPVKMPYDGLTLEQMDSMHPGEKYDSRQAMAFASSDTPRALYEYNGFIRINASGIHTFATDASGANRLFIDGIEILRNKVVAPQLPGKIDLEPGLHTVRLLAADSAGSIQVKLPGTESFAPAPIGMFATVSTPAYSDGRLVAEVIPELGKNGVLTLRGAIGNATGQAYGADVIEGRRGKALKLSGPNSRIEFNELSAPEDATSFAFWLRIDQAADVQLINSYREAEPCESRLRNFTLQADFWRASELASCDLRRQGVNIGDWAHIALTYGDTVCIYVNGNLVAEKPKTVPARSSRCHNKILFNNLQGTLENVQVYNKVLTADKIKTLIAEQF